MEVFASILIFLLFASLILWFVGGVFGALFTFSMAILSGLLGLVAYFLPTIIAAHKKHDDILPICLINIFLGWSCIGWIVALVWAFDWHIAIKKHCADKKCICSCCGKKADEAPVQESQESEKQEG